MKSISKYLKVSHGFGGRGPSAVAMVVRMCVLRGQMSRLRDTNNTVYAFDDAYRTIPIARGRRRQSKGRMKPLLLRSSYIYRHVFL